MKVGFPRLGTFHVFLEPALRPLGLDLTVAPPSSKRTLDLGVRHNPEMICAPCKILFGNYVEALERGAEILIMLGGPGTCRLGYSARTQAALLRQMGFRFEAYTVDLYDLSGDTLRFLRTVAKLSWVALFRAVRYLLMLIDVVDEVERATLRIRPLEREPGTVDRLREWTLDQVAAVPDLATLKAKRREWMDAFRAIPLYYDRQLLQVALVGDLYTMVESFFNMGLERELGRLGVHVDRCFWISDSAKELVQTKLLHRGHTFQKLRAARRYLARDIGGFARSTVGEAALFARQGVDGLIHLAPFNCTPEVMAHNALLALRREEGVPLLSLSFDEHTARAGLITRLEAFVDLLERRRDRSDGPRAQARRRGRSSTPLVDADKGGGADRP
jgi:predicted nucleotide-binding protein (sugar kinase/HSP70/actin superfamily)